jgi:hypothetical protein
VSDILVETELVVEVIEVSVDEATVVETPGTAVEIVVSPTELVVDDTSATVVEVVESGPQTFILPEEAEMYAKRVDFNADQTIIYRGEASPGSSESVAVWRIRRLTFTGAEGDVTEEWANGAALFDQVWDDHLILSYS